MQGAKAATKAAVKTKLTVQQVEIEVGLYSAKQDPKELVKFDTAGPNGGKLKYEQRAVAKPPDEQTPEPEAKGDPLGERAKTAAANARETAERLEALAAEDATESALVDGEFRQVLVEESTGEVVEADQLRRGVRLDDGRFIDCTDQLQAIEDETKLDEMRVVSFIDVGQVPRDRVLASYYVGTDDPDSLPALRLLRESMRAKRRVAVVRWSARSRQTLGVLVPGIDPQGRAVLKALKLMWAEDFRDAPTRAHLDAVTVSSAMIEQASQLVDAMSDTRESLDELRDEALALREELKARADAGEMDVEVVTPAQAEEPEADLSGQLAASLAQASGD